MENAQRGAARTRDQGVDALGAGAFKIVAAGVRVEIQRQHAPHFSELLEIAYVAPVVCGTPRA